MNEINKVETVIDAVPKQHTFALRYQQNVETVDWESCAEVLEKTEQRKFLMSGW